MTIFTIVVGLLLVVAGAAGLIGSVDLLPTEIGLLYAVCGTVALSAGVVTLAIGALIRRIDVLATAMRVAPNGHARPISLATSESAFAEAPAAREPTFSDAPAAREPAFAEAPAVREPAFAEAPAATEVGLHAPAVGEPVGEDHASRSPTTAAIERAPGEAEAAPTLVGRFSAGGANYMIFSDGSIEAETEGGAYKFASMNDFKAYLARVRG
ncbi:MAG: hypothetical protein ABR863_13930 [Roseiarcus sp.]|jgi:hypothetical protein